MLTTLIVECGSRFVRHVDYVRNVDANTGPSKLNRLHQVQKRKLGLAVKPNVNRFIRADRWYTRVKVEEHPAVYVHPSQSKIERGNMSDATKVSTSKETVTIVLPHQFATSVTTSWEDVRKRNMFPFLNASIERHTDTVHNTLVTTLCTFLLRSAHKDMHIGYTPVPADWWEHFKEECFPAWLKQRFPVKYTEKPYHYEQTIRLCPHGDFPWGHDSHLEFLSYQPITGDLLPQQPTDE